MEPARRSMLLLGLMVGLFGVFYAVFARVALHAFPFSGDEYSYVLQAELFARGLLHAPTPAHPELLRVDHVLSQPWVCSKYPPGTSALLALGVRAGVPWLVTPLEGLVALLAMASAARRVLGPRDTLVAVALVGAAPLFAFQAASFFSHTAATMWLAVAFAAVVAWTLDGRGWRMALAGAALGCALLTRPLDAVLFGVATLSLLRAPGAVRAMALLAAGVAPFVALHFAYQGAQFGSPLVDGYRAYEPTFRAIYGAHTATAPLSPANLVDGEQLWHHLDILRAFLLDWTVPGTALLAALGWASFAGRCAHPSGAAPGDHARRPLRRDPLHHRGRHRRRRAPPLPVDHPAPARPARGAGLARCEGPPRAAPRPASLAGRRVDRVAAAGHPARRVPRGPHAAALGARGAGEGRGGRGHPRRRRGHPGAVPDAVRAQRALLRPPGALRLGPRERDARRRRRRLSRVAPSTRRARARRGR